MIFYNCNACLKSILHNLINLFKFYKIIFIYLTVIFMSIYAYVPVIYDVAKQTDKQTNKQDKYTCIS